MNSIAAYCMIQVFIEYNHHFIHHVLRRHISPRFFTVFGPAYEPLVLGGVGHAGDLADPAVDVSQEAVLRI